MTDREGTRLQTLVAALNQNVTLIAHRMRLETDAVIINQCNEDATSRYLYGAYRIDCTHVNERGVGNSRNRALTQAEAELVLFSDEDIVYTQGYAQAVEKAFDDFPEADLLLFNVAQATGRETYHIDRVSRVRWYNYGRYPTYAIAARRKALIDHGLRFSPQFGGGAQYMNGEDSLFLHDCLQKGLRIIALPVSIGAESEGESTWFAGYTEKFFFDRGVLYHHLYGNMALPFAARFLLKNRSVMCKEIPFAKALAIMKKGIAHAAVSGDHGADDLRSA